MSETEGRTENGPRAPAAQGLGGGWRPLWADFRAAGAKGALFGVNGDARKQFLLGLATIAVLETVANTNNVITILHDVPEWGMAAPIVWEGSSFVASLLFLWIPWLAFRAAPPESRPIWRTLLTHAAGAIGFSLAHVTGFVLLRNVVYFLVAQTAYGLSPLTQDFGYEFRKDALTYLLIVAIFWGIGRLIHDQGRVRGERADPSTFDIRDGARLTRVRVDEILAVRSADNYVEFVLRDDRRLLMRKPLSALETELRPQGFIRTHRSWLINAAQMTALKPEGSGDYTVELGALAVPLSRRFPDALAKLRAGRSD